MRFWYYIIMCLVVGSITLNYEIGYHNGVKKCHGCGLIFDEPVFGPLWDPWFVEEE